MQDFINANRPQWLELEALVHKAGQSRLIRGMKAEDLHRLDVLYRRATIHLAQVDTRAGDPALSTYLNELVSSAHSVIYISKQRSLPRKTADYFTDTFPRAVARALPYHLISGAVFFVSALVGYFLSMHDPMAAYAILSPDEVRHLGSTKEQLLEHLHSGRDQSSAEKFAFASFLFDNNLNVGIRAASLGILAGIPTLLLLFFNGLMLGAFSAVHHYKGIYAEYWAWILPHGVTEILAIILCGGIGLQLGHAVVNPGLVSRAKKLRQIGLEMMRSLGGVAVMFILAAVIESYVRQSHLSTSTRLVIAAASGLFWAGYLYMGRLKEREQARLDAWRRELHQVSSLPA